MKTEKTMNRREFLKYQAAGALCVAGSSLALPTAVFGESRPDIAVAVGSPSAATRKAVELIGGIGRFVGKGTRVVIKPNMSFPVKPEGASNTHPEVVREVAAMCKEEGASRVLVLDNPLAPAELCLEQSGIADACKPIDKNMVFTPTSPSQYRETTISNAVSLTKTDIMKSVLESDVLIAVPVAKSHSGAGVSLSMKGMMGLIYNRGILHRLGLHTSIVDLASILKPQLVVIDGTRVLSTGGPGGPGKVLKKNTVIASADMVAADACAVSLFEWYGKKYKPSQVPYIREAHKRKLGRMDIEHLMIKTETL